MKVPYGCLLGFLIVTLVAVWVSITIAGWYSDARAYDDWKEAVIASYAVENDGDRLFDEGKYAEAAAKYAEYARLVEQRGEDASITIGELGRTLDLADRPEEAERHLRASLATAVRPGVCVYMAHFLARRRSPADAIAWAESIALSPEDRAIVLGVFHIERSEPEKALPHLKRLLKLVCGGDIAFDALNRLIVGPEPIGDERERRLRSTRDALDALAETSLACGDVDAARRDSAKGISVGRFIDRNLTYRSEIFRTCGSMRCRIVRARIAVAEEAWAKAAEEAAFAQAVADVEPARDVRKQKMELAALIKEIASREERAVVPVPSSR